LRAGTGPQRWVSEDALAAEDREESSSSPTNLLLRGGEDGIRTPLMVFNGVMWRRLVNGEVGRPLIQSNGETPTSEAASALVRRLETKPNVLEHLRHEQEQNRDDRGFSSALGVLNSFEVPNSEAAWLRLDTMFLVEVGEGDEVIEIVFTPDEDHSKNVFAPIFFDSRDVEVWIELRGYFGAESFITDAFVKPVRFVTGYMNGRMSALLHFAHNTRRRTGVLIGRVIAKFGQPD
jgi:hypothetical protein